MLRILRGPLSIEARILLRAALDWRSCAFSKIAILGGVYYLVGRSMFRPSRRIGVPFTGLCRGPLAGPTKRGCQNEISKSVLRTEPRIWGLAPCAFAAAKRLANCRTEIFADAASHARAPNPAARCTAGADATKPARSVQLGWLSSMVAAASADRHSSLRRTRPRGDWRCCPQRDNAPAEPARPSPEHRDLS